MNILKKEIWKPVKGYEGVYSISNSGKIKRTKAAQGATVGMELKPCKRKNGYLVVGLRNNGEYHKTWDIHRLVAITFLGNPPKGLEVNHKDGIKTNNHVSNFEYVTHRENMRHARDLGLFTSHSYRRTGGKNPAAKLKEMDVLKIRELFFASICTRFELSKKYKISRNTISDIINRKTWRHI